MTTRLDLILRGDLDSKYDKDLEEIRQQAETAGEGWIWKNISNEELGGLWIDFSTNFYSASFMMVDEHTYRHFSNWLKEEV